MQHKALSEDAVFEKNEKGLILREIWSESAHLNRGRGTPATSLGHRSSETPNRFLVRERAESTPETVLDKANNCRNRKHYQRL